MADYFSGHAASYVEYRPTYSSALFEFIADIVPAPRCVWDCGTGSGQAAQGLAEQFQKVIATDISAPQLQHAALDPRIEYRIAAAEQSNLDAASVDAVTAFQAAHWFDLPRFFAEAHRVLVPGGICSLWTYSGCCVNAEVDAIVKTLYDDIVGPYWPPQRRLVETGYRTIDFPFTAIAIPALSIKREWNLEAFMNYLRTWSATQRYIAAHDVDPLIELRPALDSAWGAECDCNIVTWRLRGRTGKR
ncbi:MAG: class I SAM-dependent methyltransferase [Gammaproteobacteria bacterium]|nr:class I SAM-dependent methyltransferase [Gammaproteobacteria bacterium]MDH3465035.1 class I SAM-dependent methyltransferase [Gammaproteobacteria bacterium]